MVALWNRADHYIFVLWFLSILFSSPNLSRRRLDVYHTSTHGVALVRIWNAGLKRSACGSLEMQHPKNRQKCDIWAPSHNFVGYIFATKARIDNRKKNLLKIPTSSYNMVKAFLQYGGFKLEIDIVQNIIKDYTHLANSGKTIILCWIPSHVNIRGN